MFVKLTAGSVVVQRKHTTTVHFNQSCLEIVHVIDILITISQVVNSLETNVRDIYNLFDEGLSETLHAENKVAYATDNRQFQLPV